MTTDRETLARWHAGELSYREARAGDRLRVEGRPSLVRGFPQWVPRSIYADVKPARSEQLSR